MSIDYNQFKTGKFSATQIMERLVGQREIGDNGGPIVEYATNGLSGVAWCSAIATQAMLDGNQGHWLNPIGDARFDSVSLFNHAQKLGLTSDKSVHTPNVGSIVFDKNWHAVMITGVERDPKGVPIAYTITDGNWSDQVSQRKYSVAEFNNINNSFQNSYIDSRKIDEYHAIHHPTARMFIEKPKPQPQLEETINLAINKTKVYHDDEYKHDASKSLSPNPTKINIPPINNSLEL